ncbi:MAG: PQQ-binding-like beta-propeller repeat protein [Verrucomicrobia bacterium]|nr:PQQ-binding-like beta-propeller repeat protein [Verrucomicrobiota bacterium]
MKRSTQGLIVACSLVIPAILAGRALAADWPQWRGPDRTDISKETGLLKQWPDGGPKQVWLYKEGGLGYSGFSVVGGRLFTMGARGDNEVLIALDANTGKQLWTAPIGANLKNNWGDGPRGTPTVDADARAIGGGRVYALGGQGTLICAEVASGKLLWKKTMAELGGTVPQWGYAESPLVDGGVVVCTPGGSQGAIAALDKMSGKVLWQSKEFTDGAQYSSVIAVNHNGARQYIQLTMKHFAGVAAKDGKLLWQCDWPNGRTAVIPTPIFQDGHVYIASGYGAGCALTKIGAGNQTSEVYANKTMVNHHGGVILAGDHLYGYSDGKGWTCQNLKTGEAVWADKTLGKGAVGCLTEGMLYCLEENSGAVVLAEASPKGWKEHGRFKLDPQTQQRSPKGKIWTHPVVANGKLYLRDQELIFCFDVKGK